MKHDILPTNVVVNVSLFWESYLGDILFTSAITPGWDPREIYTL